jgi:hypothetical protein
MTPREHAIPWLELATETPPADFTVPTRYSSKVLDRLLNINCSIIARGHRHCLGIRPVSGHAKNFVREVLPHTRKRLDASASLAESRG